MSSPEQLKSSLDKINMAINGIQDFGSPEVSAMAQNVVSKISARELIVMPGDNSFSQKAVASDFDMFQIVTNTMSQFAGIIQFDIEKMVQMPLKAVQADMVRTIAVAAQFPYSGYQERYKDVYGRAIKAQKDWISEWNTEAIELDPREINEEDLLSQLLGEARYYSDTGFSDWLSAATQYFKYASKQISHDERAKLLQSASSMNQFLSLRHLYTQMSYDSGLQVIGNDYIDQYTQEKRTETAAMLFIGLSTHASR